MLNIEKTVLPSPMQWEMVIEGMRNPMNSWDKSDSGYGCQHGTCKDDCADWYDCYGMNADMILGENDLDLMRRLAAGGSVHAKYRRMIPVYVTINAPLYWWKEFDTYKVGTVANSCSTMHKIHAKKFELDDFSHDHLINEALIETAPGVVKQFNLQALGMLEILIAVLNTAREMFLRTKDNRYWWQMIQLLPSSYNQKRTVMLNYEVLVNIYRWRRDHKLDEWHTFCDWIESLPYSELITGKEVS